MNNPQPTTDFAPELDALRARLGEDAIATSNLLDNMRILAQRENLIDVLKTLKTECGYALLSELGATDYLNYPGKSPTGHRFEVHYVLRNLDANRRLVVKVGVDDDDPVVPSAMPLWAGADWMEREVFDMVGIRFEGHPDLRRILMPEEFTAFPLRKDYPLRGRGERHNFPRLTREQS